jgi:CorA-like Mg2+ transporter protein
MPDPMTTTVSIAWRTWDADQQAAGPKVALTPLDALTDLGARVMVAVGPDRYGIRLRAPGSPFARGELPYPNEPFPVRITSHLTALTSETDALASDLRAFETDVTKALAATDEGDVRTALARAQELLARRSELVGRARSIVDAHEQLTRRRPEAFTIEAQDSEQTMDQVDERLERLRGELVDIPQLLLAAGSWRQAQRTETLSLVAAALIPPTLVVGALGANILPWRDTGDWRALVGMLLLMLGSAAAGILAVRWSMFRSPPTGRVWRGVAVVAVAACVLGLYWLVDGTATRPT